MPSRAFTDHVLRTFAAVPLPEKVLVQGDPEGEISEKLRQLGFEVENWRDDSDETWPIVRGSSQAGWAVVVCVSQPTGEVSRLLGSLWSKIRSGGWVIVGVEGTYDDAGIKREMLTGVDLEIDAAGYAVAEKATSHPDGYHFILRRTDPDTIV